MVHNLVYVEVLEKATVSGKTRFIKSVGDTLIYFQYIKDQKAVTLRFLKYLNAKFTITGHTTQKIIVLEGK